MGHIADMMLDGTLCECCGTFIDDDEPGFPRYCSRQCAKDRGALLPKHKAKKPKIAPVAGAATPAKPSTCSECGQAFPSKNACKAHRRTMHPVPDTLA